MEGGDGGVQGITADDIIPGIVPDGFEACSEGKAQILTQSKDAFFNPAQVVNRDLSIAVLRQFIKLRKAELAEGKLKLKCNKKGAPKNTVEAAKRETAEPGKVQILEALAASGLRAIRYALELEDVSSVVANDVDPASVEAMQRNVAFNGDTASEVVQPTQNDARVLMLQKAGTFDVVDLDPYGAPVQFLDSAVQAASEGGMLCITATDMAVLCGNHGDACWGKYGSYPLHKPYCHEQALRILLASVQSHAARHKRIIIPVLSISIDFYIRVFVRIYTSPKDVKEAASRLMYVYQSSGCDAFYAQPVGQKEEKGKSVKYIPGRGPVVQQTCPETGARFVMGGPFWSGPLHDGNFVANVLQQIKDNAGDSPTHAKVISLLTNVLEELPDVPLYYNTHDLSKLLKVTPPPQDVFRSALVNAGYRVSSTHANPLGVKTDAPPEIVWDVMRAWAKQHANPKRQPDPDSYHDKILNKTPTIEVDFSRASAALSAARTNKIARFPLNPEANWGPKRRHTRQPESESNRPVKRGKTEEATLIEENGVKVSTELAAGGDHMGTDLKREQTPLEQVASEALNVEQTKS